MEIVKKSNISILTSDKIDVPHGFTLRFGGVSEGDFDSLNVGLRRGDNPFNAMKNIEICCDEMGLCKNNITLTYQLHTDKIRIVTKDDIGKGIFREWGEGVDGVITEEKNIPLMCYSADCVPTLFYDKIKGVVGAVHGGWRGTKEAIVKKAVEAMESLGCEKNNIIAFIGPAIGGCCYEVGEDVANEFSQDYPELVKDKGNGKYMLDLKSITENQLLQEGLKKENIENCMICTMCENGSFFSHRGGKGKSGLLGGFIQLV